MTRREWWEAFFYLLKQDLRAATPIFNLGQSLVIFGLTIINLGCLTYIYWPRIQELRTWIRNKKRLDQRRRKKLEEPVREKEGVR